MTSYYVFSVENAVRCATFADAVAEREAQVSAGRPKPVIARHVETRVVEVGDPMTTPSGLLSGGALRSVIEERVGRRNGEPFHYRELYAEIEQAGHTVGGRDPIATFLTQLTRADGIERTGGNRSGLYRRRLGDGP